MGLTPLQTLLDDAAGSEVAIPPELARLYGPLRFPRVAGRPHVVSNFVASLDGVVSLAVPGHEGGKVISGDEPHDEMVVGLLRSVADAMVIGASELRESPGHRFAPGDICPALATAYLGVRRAAGRPDRPPIYLVSGRGDLDPRAALLQPGEPTVVLTTADGARRLVEVSKAVEVRVLGERAPLPAAAILDTVARDHPEGLILLEAGPHLTAALLEARLIHELFLTLAPQVAGRDALIERPGWVAGVRFAPEHPRWARLVGVKRGRDHLFLRYAFPEGEQEGEHVGSCQD